MEAINSSSSIATIDNCSHSNGNFCAENSRDLAAHFLELVRLGAAATSCNDAMEVDEDDTPTELNTINSSGGFLVVSPDKLSVKYTSVNLHGHDVGVIQANKPAPVKRLIYYFEIYVKEAGAKGQVAIGFSKENFKMRRQPGWEANSCGYHGDDGFIYRGQGRGEAFGPTYTTGDTVGGGINYASQEFFFTKNGAVVGTVPKDIKGLLFPTIAVHSQNEEVYVNFGQKKFAFDVKECESQERNKQQMAIESISMHPSMGYGLVRTYLLHYGYEDTVNVFDSTTKSMVPPIYIAKEDGSDEHDIAYALNQRKCLRQLIRKGDIDDALSKLRDWYPQIVQDDKTVVCFLLHCQKFIELVRVGALEEAVRYGRFELGKFSGIAGFSDLVQDCVGLLAYEQPGESCVGYLLEDPQRELVADAVNTMILSTNPNKENSNGFLQSNLERLLLQITACSWERRSLNEDQGEVFNLNWVLDSNKKARS